MTGTIFAAVASFAATNLDDLMLLTLLFGVATDRREQRHILLGQGLGIAALFALSVFASGVLRLLPDWTARLLGLVPLALGVRAIFANTGDRKPGISGVPLNVLPIALLTISDGGDNLGVYIPLFRGMGRMELAVTAAIYAALVIAYCGIARSIASLPGIRTGIHRAQKWLVPAVFLGLGIMIICRSHT